MVLVEGAVSHPVAVKVATTVYLPSADGEVADNPDSTFEVSERIFAAFTTSPVYHA